MKLHLLLLSSVTAALTAPSQTNPAVSHITPPPPNHFAQAIIGGGTPTTNPNILWIDGELKKRQQIQVCGYLNGQSAYPYYCEAGAVCSTDGNLNWAGCCPAAPGVPCPQPTSCVPMESIGYCGVGCADDPHMLLCPYAEYPHCVSVEMRLPSETLWSYGCGIPALTTHLAVDWVAVAGQAPLTGAGGAPVATTLTTTPTKGLAGGNTNNQGIGGNGNNYNFGDNAHVNISVGTSLKPSLFLLFGFWWFVW